MKINRRSFLTHGSKGFTALLVRSLASGLPVAYLLDPSESRAQQMMSSDIQTLILSTSSRGDPINVNCPGSYVDGVTNNPNLETARANFGSTRARAAQVWCGLPNDLRQRLAFFHYRPRSAAHPEYRSVMAMKGSIKNDVGNGSEMFASAMSQLAYSMAEYKQVEPIPLCDSSLTFLAQPLQQIKPLDLKALFSPTDQDLVDLRRTRDQVLDGLYANMQVRGNLAQREFIERYASSRVQARNLGTQLGDLLNDLPTDPEENNTPLDQVIAAVALAKARISPVMTINIPFGGDNHQDTGLVNEATQTTEGVQLIGRLWSELKEAGIQDQVSFATMNVFGRRSYTNTRGGRDHNQHHAVMVAFGKNVQGGVYGGMNSEGQATAINGIPPELTMEAAGFSMARALGHSNQVVQARIPNGQLVNSFLA